MTRKLEGKVALVTGAGRGIGRSIALKLAGEGARLVLNDLDQEVGESAAKLINDSGGHGNTLSYYLCQCWRFTCHFKT